MLTVENGYLKFNSEDIKTQKKIAGHSFVSLIGKNDFKKRGDEVLEMLGIVSKEKIDPFYQKRGGIAEYLIKKYYEKNNMTYESISAKDVNFDYFKESKFFGGVPDGILDGNTIVEIKSKNISKINYIKMNPVDSEEYQAKFYATILGYDKAIMQYVFFPDDLEEKIKNGEPITSLNVKTLKKDLIFNRNDIMQFMALGLKYYYSCVQTFCIPLKDISEKYIEKLKNEKGVVFNE